MRRPGEKPLKSFVAIWPILPVPTIPAEVKKVGGNRGEGVGEEGGGRRGGRGERGGGRGVWEGGLGSNVAYV